MCLFSARQQASRDLMARAAPSHSQKVEELASLPKYSPYSRSQNFWDGAAE